MITESLYNILIIRTTARNTIIYIVILIIDIKFGFTILLLLLLNLSKRDHI